MANISTLNPAITTDEARKRGRAGGLKSGEARRRKKAMREVCEIVLAMPLKSLADAKAIDLADICSLAETKGMNITVQDAIVLKQIQLALMGSHKSFELIRDTVGEKPKERVETSTETLDKLDDILANIGGVI